MMDKKFLNRVLDQIVRETRLDHEKKRFFFPFSLFSFFIPFFTPFIHFFPLFSKHCEDVYGLNDDETEYVWEKYKNIIKDKIK